jgi:Skp family chaperone for outer membrane proteins
MKKSIQYLLAVGAFASAAFTAQAQPALKIATVDMTKLYETHWKTLEQTTKVKADMATAQVQYDQMTKDLTALKAGVDALVEEAKNPTATPDAVKKAQDQAQAKYEQLQARANDRNTFQQTVHNEVTQRMQNFHDLMMEEISHKAIEAAKSHGATILLDKSGITVLGAHAVLYSDPGYDVTEEVAAAIAKDKPASSATAAAPAAAAPAPAPADGSQIELPPITPAK